MRDWPSTLPLPLASGYSLSPVDPVVRTEMEAGASRARRTTRARNDKVSLSWAMTRVQFEEFRAWYDDDTDGAAGGAAWFPISLDIGTGGAILVSAKFAKIYDASMVDPDLWKVTGNVEVRDA